MSNPDPKSVSKTAAAAPTPVKPPPLFRAVDWWVFALTTLVVFIGYYFTIAPNVTLEDSGELATASLYAGVPHPPGYPVWTLYTWFFTKILPGNIAWRVGISSAFAGAVAAGLISLMVSRGCSQILEGMKEFKNVDRKWENAICFVAAYVAGMLFGFNGFVWSQSVIVEVYSLSMLSLMGVMVCLMRWYHAPDEHRHLYWGFFWFGICFTNHQTLICAAMGILVAIVFRKPSLGRDLLFASSIIYVLGVLAMAAGKGDAIRNNTMLFVIFHLVGVCMVAGCIALIVQTGKLMTEWLPSLIIGGMFIIGAAFYFYMPVASMSNPPLNWGYPRTAEGFVHAFTRGQYEQTRPTDLFSGAGLTRFFEQLALLAGGAIEEFSIVSIVISLVPFIFFFRMEKRDKAWMIGTYAMYACLAFLLVILLNPSTDRQSRELTKVFFGASHIMISLWIGYGIAILGGLLLTQYEKIRWPLLAFAAISSGIALYVCAVVGVFGGGEEVVASTSTGFFPKIYEILFALELSYNKLVHFTAMYSLALAVLAVISLLVWRKSAPTAVILVIFFLFPIRSIVAHWENNEQLGHLYGYYFGHDMFTPPYGVYPEMDKDTVLFGGTDPGRFNPTYMIFCESFVPSKDKQAEDPKFDRRDVYLITQNALADNTYLDYIRAQYNRSAQNDPPFFQNFLRSRFFVPLDRMFLKIGDNIEKSRRAGTSLFQEADFTDMKGLAAKLAKKEDAVSKYVAENLSAKTQGLLGGGGEDDLKEALAEDLNVLLAKETFYTNGFSGLTNLSDHSRRYAAENPQSHTRIRWNRLLLEDAFPKEIAKSIGGVYPDLEIRTPSKEDSQACFNEYLMDAQRRLQLNQLRPGEDVRAENGRVQVSGQVAVMAINGLLTKVIFDKNPGHSFYVEESFPLEWMFPHLTPSGIIMKINRQKVPVITDEIVQKDHEFWSKYSDRLIGDWITYDTPVSNICHWAEQVYLYRNYGEFKGDMKFIRDDNAQKAFSKLRSSIGGIYLWRLGYSSLGFDCPAEFRASKNPEEMRRVIKECDFAFKQAFAYCPFSPEAVFRYVQFLTNQGRHEDAVLVAKTCLKLDPQNDQMRNLVDQVESISANFRRFQPQTGQTPGQPPAPGFNVMQAFNEAVQALAAQKTNEAVVKLDQIVESPATPPEMLLQVARVFAMQIGDSTRLEKTLTRLVQLVPDNPEAWYDLAGLQAMLGRPQALESLRKAVTLSDARLKQDPKAMNLATQAAGDPRFGLLKASPEFQQVVSNK